jgi:hypothetical protein
LTKSLPLRPTISHLPSVFSFKFVFLKKSDDQDLA